MKFRLRNLALWVIVVLSLLALFTLFQDPAQRSPARTEISFSQLLNDADAGKIGAATIQESEIGLIYKDGRRFTTYAPNEPGLAQRLHAKGVIVSARPKDEPPWAVSLLISWLPFIALIGVWIYLSNRMRAGSRASNYGTAAAVSGKALNDPLYWHGRTEEARALSAQLSDDESKRRMVEIIHGYEYLAARAEERQRGSQQP